MKISLRAAWVRGQDLPPSLCLKDALQSAGMKGQKMLKAQTLELVQSQAVTGAPNLIQRSIYDLLFIWNDTCKDSLTGCFIMTTMTADCIIKFLF